MTPLSALAPPETLAEAARGPVCLLLGADDALRTRCVQALLAAAVPPDQPGSTVRTFESVPLPHEVFDELRTIPFMGLAGRRVVVVDRGDAFLKANAEALASYLARPSESGLLILCLDAAEGKAARGIVKAADAIGTVVECRSPSWRDAKQWLRSAAQGAGCRITPGAVDALVEAVGPNLLLLQAEVEKLSAYAGPGVTIAERDVEALVPQARSRSAFNLADAVARADLAEAARVCRGLLLAGESKEGIIAILALQVRRLWQILRLTASGGTEASIARELGVRTFVVRQASRMLPRLTERKLAAQLRILAVADVESKTTSLRSHEETAWMEALLARLCGAGG